jgi:hypothetical protein
MEVAVGGEALPDQGRADDLAVALDQAAVRLGREERLGEAGDGERIEQAGVDGRERDADEGGTEMRQQGASGGVGDRRSRGRATPIKSLILWRYRCAVNALETEVNGTARTVAARITQARSR